MNEKVAVRKYFCECGCKRDIGKGTAYYQFPKSQKRGDYIIVHKECGKAVKE